MKVWFFIESTVISSSPAPHLQLAAMKQNSRPVVGEAPESPGVGLDELDGAVETFGAGVGDLRYLKT